MINVILEDDHINIWDEEKEEFRPMTPEEKEDFDIMLMELSGIKPPQPKPKYEVEILE